MSAGSFALATNVPAPLRLGTVGPDSDGGTPVSAGADLDDTSNVDDEDGFNNEMFYVTPGNSFTRPGVVCTGPGSVAGWVDWNRDGDFADTGERSAVAACASGSSTVDLTWSVPAGAVESVDSRFTFARLRIAADAGELNDPTGMTSFGETEDHAVQVKLQALAISKTSDAASHGGVVVPGQTVTYTVTGTNPGPALFTAGSPATLVDDLSGVLDDATYNNDAVVGGSGTGAPTWDAGTQRLGWSGALGVGQSVSLTYSVTLKAGGDGTIRNVAFQPISDGRAVATPTCSSTVVDPLYAGGTVLVDSTTRYPCAAAQSGFTSYKVSFFYQLDDGTGGYPATANGQVTRQATLADQS
ncbi:MAG: DUF11 domain-containing protein, partial [Propionibacteriaceae bacterium]|nr:DUF11 domain-containing protein [Propionibacteriaceae bacterium]